MGVAVAGPYQQGQLDGLCGIYSVVNAVALLTATGRPLGRRRSRQLFAVGLEVVAAHGDLHRAIHDGIAPDLWFAVIAAMVADVAQQQALCLKVRRPFIEHDDVGWPDVRHAAEAALDRQAVVLVQLAGTLRHYSVLAAHTPRRFLLHDSSALRWLDKAGCGVAPAVCRHQFVADALVTLDVVL